MFMPQPQGTERRLRSKWRVQKPLSTASWERFLLELHQRNVASPAPGRRRLLDQEIPNAIREVLLQEMSRRIARRTEIRSRDSARCPSHTPRASAALDVLEQLYSNG